MKRNRRIPSVLALMLAAVMLGGCTAQQASPANSSEASAPGGAAASDYQVAILLSGYKNDAGWNQSAYEGMELAKEEFGITYACSEAVAQPDYESAMRDYASQGYNLIICAGNQFSDAVLSVAPDFPDVDFAVMNGNDAREPNVGAYRFDTTQTGFLAGALAAMYSESGIVGTIGGDTSPHIQDAVLAFKAGAEYVNPEIQVLTGYTETMTDIAKGKEMGMAFIEQGADVLNANANSASLGVIDAAEEAGVRCIGYINHHDVAPETVMVDVVQSNQFMIRTIVASGLEDTFSPTINLYGVAEGAIYVDDFDGNDALLSTEQQDQFAAILEGVTDGSLKENGVLPKSTFEG